MPDNPLCPLLIPILRAHPSGLTEYQLIQRLKDQGVDFPAANCADLALFQTHFLVMNALYRLQPLFREQGYRLQISALKILLHPLDSAHDNRLPDPGAEQPLRDYYLDWRHFEQSTTEEVRRLLQSFWRRYQALDQKQAALETLELAEDSDWRAIRDAYRRLASRHHPDRGGDPERFRSIREAYEQLAAGRVG